MAAKNDGKTIFGKKWQITLHTPCGPKFRPNLSISHHFQDKCVFVFYTEIQDGSQKLVGKRFFGKKCHMTVHTLQTKNFVKMALSRTTSEILKIFHFHY